MKGQAKKFDIENKFGSVPTDAEGSDTEQNPNQEGAVPEEPTIVELENDGSYAVIQMPDGIKYELRHPGVRAIRKAKDDAMDLKTGRFLMERYLDSLFRSVFRHKDNPGPKPTLDNISISLAAYFENILPLFADGKLSGLGEEEEN